MASTVTLENVVTSARAYASLTPILPATGYINEPARTIANYVMQQFLQEPFNWKFNRANASPFLTVTLQQDYITSITNMAWIESGTMVNINNTSIPLPIYPIQAVRDLQPCSIMNMPVQISWLPNSLAQFGQWQANTLYPTALGTQYTPNSPIQQFIDVNGNYLYVTGFGTSGPSAPSLPAGSPAGTTVVDNTVTWTVADPNGIAFRLAPLPPISGIVWSLQPVYQMKAPIFTSLSQTLAPIPDEYSYLFIQGFLTYCYRHIDNTQQYVRAEEKWLIDMQTALRGSDREMENFQFIREDSFGGDFAGMNIGVIGPAWPFSYGYQ